MPGYTHFWRRTEHLNRARFAEAAQDVRRILDRTILEGMKLAGPTGEGQPEVDDRSIAFNGLSRCDHLYRNLGEPWPAAEAEGFMAQEEDPIEPGEPYYSGPYLKMRACGGKCSEEPFVVDRDWLTAAWHRPEKGGFFSARCATLYKPYDLVVTAALIRLKEHLKDEIVISSDGDEKAFHDAKRLCRQLFGWHTAFELESKEPSLV